MTPDHIAGFCWRDAMNATRDYYERGWADDRCALIVTVLDKIEQDARRLFAAAQPGKDMDEAALDAARKDGAP